MVLMSRLEKGKNLSFLDINLIKKRGSRRQESAPGSTGAGSGQGWGRRARNRHFSHSGEDPPLFSEEGPVWTAAYNAREPPEGPSLGVGGDLQPD